MSRISRAKRAKTLPYGHRWIAWRWRGQFWPRIILAVKLLAETGVSTALDLLLLLSRETGAAPPIEFSAPCGSRCAGR